MLVLFVGFQPVERHLVEQRCLIIGQCLPEWSNVTPMTTLSNQDHVSLAPIIVPVFFRIH